MNTTRVTLTENEIKAILWFMKDEPGYVSLCLKLQDAQKRLIK